MPDWFETYLNGLTAREKAELGCWFCSPENDNEESVNRILEAIGA